MGPSLPPSETVGWAGQEFVGPAQFPLQLSTEFSFTAVKVGLPSLNSSNLEEEFALCYCNMGLRASLRQRVLLAAHLCGRRCQRALKATQELCNHERQIKNYIQNLQPHHIQFFLLPSVSGDSRPFAGSPEMPVPCMGSFLGSLLLKQGELTHTGDSSLLAQWSLTGDGPWCFATDDLMISLQLPNLPMLFSTASWKPGHQACCSMYFFLGGQKEQLDAWGFFPESWFMLFNVVWPHFYQD